MVRSGKFAACMERRHSECRRSTRVPIQGMKELQDLYCSCNDDACDCSKNPRQEGVQVPNDGVQ